MARADVRVRIRREIVQIHVTGPIKKTVVPIAAHNRTGSCADTLIQLIVHITSWGLGAPRPRLSRV